MSAEEAFDPRGRLLARNTGLNLVGQVLTLLVAAAAIPVVIHALGPQRFGVLGLGWMAISYIGEVGFGRSTTRFVAEALGRGDSERLASVTWGNTLAQLAVGLVGGILLAVVAPLLTRHVLRLPPAIQPEASRSFLVLAAGVPLLVLASSFRGILEAAQRFGAVNAVRVPTSAANYAVPLIGALLGLDIPWILGIILAVRAVALAAYVVLSLRAYPVLWPPFMRFSDLPELIRFGNWITIATLIAPSLVYLDRALLAVLVGVAAVGYYTPAFELVLRLLVLPVAVTGTLFPAFSTLAGRAEPDRVGALVARSTKYVLLVVGPASLLLAAASQDLLTFWLGAAFAARVSSALQLLALGVLLNASAYISVALLYGAGRADLPGKVYLAELPLYAPLAWWSIHEWGIPGAALAWTIRAGADALVLAVLAGRAIPEVHRAVRAAHVPQTLAMIMAAGVAVVAVVGAVPGVWARGAVTAAALAATTLLLWRHSFSPEERAQLQNLLTLRRGQ